eukprot:TRINITY_DN2389_c1_g1_i8.p1 TRINITY_DN2389_c1_g1~~TRINITY_DN2389_c1_g1_i8.p1  ORF type:complete len:381 (-),score=42.52 TRINITY_DN2389_c1_g1_i8:223-1365(-)
MSSGEWQWAHLTGGHAEQLVADLGSGEIDGARPGRGCIVVQTNARDAFHIVFSHISNGRSRDSGEPVLRFVVGKRRNSVSTVGLGNPYINKEPVESTRNSDALLTDDETKTRTFWFLYDRNVGIAAMGVQAEAQADLCRLAVRFRREDSFKAEACEHVRYISVASGKRPVSLRIVKVCAPPDISIPRFRFDPEAWELLPWNGCSCIFELDDQHRHLVQKAQAILAKSPLAPFYGFVPAQCLCLNPYRLLDPLRRGEMYPPEFREAAESEPEWPSCYDELQQRLSTVFASAAWTYWPLQFDKSDCTSLTLAPISKGGARAITDWAAAVRDASRLRNSATSREILSVTFAFQVFPVHGEHVEQARRDVIREVTDMMQKEWGH